MLERLFSWRIHPPATSSPLFCLYRLGESSNTIGAYGASLLLSALAVMLLYHGSPRLRPRLPLLSVALLVVTVWSLCVAQQRSAGSADAASIANRFPLTWHHIASFNGSGGAWLIPPEWVEDRPYKEPQTIVEAASLASKAAVSDSRRQLDFSDIPLIVHQTAASKRILTWNREILPMVEQWLQYANSSWRGRPMAYLFWDDDGILDFMRRFESGFLETFLTFTPVERVDIFRILACKIFGGVYADIDTEPLQHPATWIRPSDISAWEDTETGSRYGQSKPAKASTTAADGDGNRPVKLVWGLEADTDPASDSYWRMGYSYPVQLTQWALASAPQHPVLSQYMDNLKAWALGQGDGRTTGMTARTTIPADPLTRTGPAAVTLATRMWLEKRHDFRWNALTGLWDGGRSKLVSDVLVLPITGFSPGRGSYGNMGSKPRSHPDARLYHHAVGSWRQFSVHVEYGKLCRTLVGRCRDWSKVPGQS